MDKLKIGIVMLLVGIAILGIAMTDVNATHTSMCQSGGSCHSAGYCGAPGFECCYSMCFQDSYGWHCFNHCDCC